jgi:hypothetical protein
MDLEEIGCEVDWIYQTQGRVQWWMDNKPSGSIEDGEFLDQLSCSKLLKNYSAVF